MNIQDIQIGDGATEAFGSDCYPYTVIAKTNSSVTIQRDDYKCIKGSGHDGSAEYEYSRNTNGVTRVIKFRKGLPTKSNGRVHFGYRRFYQDPSF